MVEFDDSLFEDKKYTAPEMDDSLFEDVKFTEPPSELESFVRGAAQGATFGFSDEITGAGEALGKAIFGDDKISDLLDNYRKYQKESEAAYKSAEETNPASYMVGDIGAGIGTGLLTGGAGAIANLGKVGAKQGLKELAKVGAKQGLAAGTGYSEGDLSSLEGVKELASDAVIGGATGATMGAGLPLAGKAVSKTASTLAKPITTPLSLISKSRFGQSVKDAYRLGTKGKSTVGVEGEEQFVSNLIDNSKQLLNTYDKQMKEGSKLINKAIKVADQQNAPKNYSTQLNAMKKQFQKGTDKVDEYESLLKQLEGLKRTYEKKTTVTGKEQVLNKIQKMQDKMQVVADELGEDVTFSPIEIINKPSGDIASFNARTRKLDNQGEVQDILQPKAIPVPEDKVITETLEGFNNASLQDLQRAKQNLQNVGYGNSSLGNQATATSKKAAKQLDTMIKENIPENVRGAYSRGNELRTLGYEAQDLVPSLKSNTEEKRVSGIMSKLLNESKSGIYEAEGLLNKLPNISQDIGEELSDLNTWKNLVKPQDFNLGQGITNIALGGSKGLSTNVANIAGRATRDVVKSTPVQLTKKLVNLPRESVNRAANYFNQSGNEGLQSFGKVLNKILSEESGSKRDALMWSLSQQPAFRQEMERLLNAEEDQQME